MKAFTLALAMLLGNVCALMSAGNEAKISLKVNHLVDDMGEGPSASRAYVMLGRTKVAMREPTGCEIDSTSDMLSIDLAGRNLRGDIQITHSAIDPALGFSPSNIETYSDAALSVFASHIKNLNAESVRANPYVGFDWRGIALQFTYELTGKRYRREIAFVNIDENNQLMISTRAEEEDFDRVLGVVAEFMSSWYPMRESSIKVLN